MKHSKNKKKKHGVEEGLVELNVMPFIDIFSLLCTFLLFSAVFVSIGIIEVQIPFLTNAAAPQNKNEDKPKRSLEVKASIGVAQIELNFEWSLPPVTPSKESFARTAEGIESFHQRLLDLKDQDKDADKITVFVDDEVIYDDLIAVLDAIKLSDYKKGAEKSSSAQESELFPKIIMGSVML